MIRDYPLSILRSPVPPSPELEKRILKTKRRFLKGDRLPDISTGDLLDLRSFVLIAHRPANTRAHSFSASPKLAMPAIGERKALVLLVDFQDNVSKTPVKSYEDMLFSSGKYRSGSLRDYYYEASYHKLTVKGDVSGGDKGWHRAPNSYSYYVNRKYGFGEYPRNAAKLVEDAVDIAAKHIDFAEYDNDGDGVVDALFIVHAGPGAEATGNTNHIWSHMSTIPAKTANGVKIINYSMEPEDGRVGVFCHELGHVFGLPDLYDYDMGSEGTGNWDLMAGGSWNNGGVTPAHPIGWCKVRLGWINPEMVQEPKDGVNLRPSCFYPDIYKLSFDGNDGKEYFLIENRQRIGFDRYLPGSGLMIEHIDEGQFNNNDQSRYLVNIEQCDGREDLNKNLNRGDEGDLYPNNLNNEFSADTNPSSRFYSGQDSHIDIKNISRSGENIVLDIAGGSISESGWHYNSSISMTFDDFASQWAWAYIADIGWRRIKEESSNGRSNAFNLCCRAAADGLKVHVYADNEFVHVIYLA